MNNIKNDIVNKAIKFTRDYRPIIVDIDGNILEGPSIWEFGCNGMDRKALIDLCVSIQRFIYGEEHDESDEHKNG